MNEFETKIELCGAEYTALISFEWDDTYPIIDKVKIILKTKHHYNDQGEYAPYLKHIDRDITEFLDAYQLAAFADDICADALCKKREAEAEAKILTREYRELETV